MDPIDINSIQVRLTVHSEAGHLVITEPIPSVVQAIKDQISKLGKWLYVGNKRFKFDPNSAADEERLVSELAATPSARLTGSLRGGQPMTTSKPKRVRKSKSKVKKIVRKGVKRKIEEEGVTSNTNLPAISECTMVIRDDEFDTSNLGTSEMILGVFTLDLDTKEVRLFKNGTLLKDFAPAVGTLFVNATE